MRSCSTLIRQSTVKIWSTGRSHDVDPRRLLMEKAKFSPSVMVSAGVCFGGKGRLHFVEEKAKINAAYYISNLLPKLIEDCVIHCLKESLPFSRMEHPLTVHALRKIGSSS